MTSLHPFLPATALREPGKQRPAVWQPGAVHGGNEKHSPIGVLRPTVPVVCDGTTVNKGDCTIIDLDASLIQDILGKKSNVALLRQTTRIVLDTDDPEGLKKQLSELDRDKVKWREEAFSSPWLKEWLAERKVPLSYVEAIGAPYRAPNCCPSRLTLELHPTRDPRFVLKVTEEIGSLEALETVDWRLLGETVSVLGGASGYREGVVELVDADVRGLCYAMSDKDTCRANFTGVFVVRGTGKEPFARPGDSGALVFRRSGDRLCALGMVLAGLTLADGTSRALVVPLSALLALLDRELFVAA